MSLVAEQWEFLKDFARLVEFCEKQGLVVTGGELWRTPEQQRVYVDTGRSQTMNSNHLKRLAVDLNFFKDGKLVYDDATIRPVGEFWESLHAKNRWGGNWHSFKDRPHFERRA